MADLKLGQVVELNDGRQATIRFIGPIHVSQGQFVGVELFEGGGKNDGSVQGERYFECAPGYGLFIRSTGIADIIAEPEPAAPPAPPAPKPAPITKPPTPAGAAPGRPRPSSITTKTTLRAPNAPASSRSPPTGRPTTQPLTARPAPPQPASSRPPRQSLATRKGSNTSQKSIASTASNPSVRRTSTLQNPPPKPTIRTTSNNAAPATRRESTSQQPPASSNTKSGPSQDALETKLRLAEKQRSEDREKLVKLEQVQKDYERLEGIIKKLQTKCQSYYNDNTELKTRLASVQSDVDRLSKAEQDYESILELATVDREVAEERAEAAEAEIEVLRQKIEECELEMQILRSEVDLNATEMTEEDREAAGYLLLERENERLKQALLRLHEYTKATEKEDKEKISELEKDLLEFDVTRQQKGELEAIVRGHEETIQELRQQLDAANAWEDIIEDLSEQNDKYKTQIEEHELVIADLQNLKELNDELEAHRLEQEAELKNELELREVELNSHLARLQEQQLAIADQDVLLSKFKDLVSDLQSKMMTIQSSQLMTEEQAKDVTNRFHDVMDLNRRLRHMSNTSTLQTIDTGLMKIDLEIGTLHSEIIRLFWNAVSADDDEAIDFDPSTHESLFAYFRFKRIEGKAALVHHLFGSLDTFMSEESREDVDAILRLEIMYRLNEIRYGTKELWRAVEISTPEQLPEFAPSNREAEPIELALEVLLECFRADEFNLEQINGDLRRCETSVQDLQSRHSDLADNLIEGKLLLNVSLVKNALEFIISTYGVIDTRLHKMTLHDDGASDEVEAFLDEIAADVSLYKEAALMADKLLRVLETLFADQLYPKSLAAESDKIIIMAGLLSERASSIRVFTMDFAGFLADSFRENSEPIHVAGVAKQYKSLKTSLKEPTGSDYESGLAVATLVRLKTWYNKASDLVDSTEFEHGQAPWILKARQLQDRKKRYHDTEERLQELTDRHRMLVLSVKEREEALETKDLEIEHLKAKQREAATKADELARAKATVNSIEREKRQLLDTIQNLRSEIERVKEESARYSQSERAELQESNVKDNYQIRAEAPTKLRGPNAGYVVFLQALRNENHWLRQYNNEHMFRKTLTNALDCDRKEKTRRDRIAKITSENGDRALDIAYCIQTLNPNTPQKKMYEETYKKYKEDFPSSPSNPSYGEIGEEFSSPLVTRSTPLFSPPVFSKNRSYLQLSPIKTFKWTPAADRPWTMVGEAEMDEFEDLSPLSTEFSFDDEDADLKGFSALDDASLEKIMGKVM